ncbi:transposase, IS5 family [Desulfomicrobium norvegicum]|uniref:Transposase, IS5 family n=1 Tax=Desulfomicrobium norvegicum (strain DSM 1741 / NCIMB 8310) TaxID=52561 RepID=A0A8G2F641_DESNO|nr:transposase, IS5 family [Desulfomicrobium norvegicum]
MQPKKSDHQRSFLCPDLLDQLDPRNHLLGLAKVIPWQVFEDNFRLTCPALFRPVET